MCGGGRASRDGRRDEQPDRRRGPAPVLRRPRAVVAAHLATRRLHRRGKFAASLLRTADGRWSGCSSSGAEAAATRATEVLVHDDARRPSPSMLEVSCALNPECEHVGRHARPAVGSHFDAVFVHDAIDYMRTEVDAPSRDGDGVRALSTRWSRGVCARPLTERFEPETDHGGADGADGRAVRYLFWTELGVRAA